MTRDRFWGRRQHRPIRGHEVHPYPHDLPVGGHADRKSELGGGCGTRNFEGWAMYALRPYPSADGLIAEEAV